METNIDKQKLIVEAARKLFEDYGFKRVSMDEIASYANVAKGTIYLYFKSKAELFQHLVKEDMGIMEQIARRAAENSHSIFEEMHTVLYEILKYRKSKKLIITMTRELQTIGTPSIRACLDMMNRAIVNYIHMRLQKAVEQKEIKPCKTEIIAFLIFKMYMSLSYDWEEVHKTLDEKEILESIGMVLRTGLKA